MKISILLITYNHEKYIRKAVESILVQKECADFEIIVSDDHSTDGTISIVKEMLGSLSNVSISSNEKNIGITKNYQQAFSLCKGEYIFILEGDDYWIDPYKIKKQTEFMDEYPDCGMCGHPYYVQKDDTNELMPVKIIANDYYTMYDCKDIILDPSSINNFSVGCYRRSALEKIAPETYDVITYDWMINISIAQFGPIGRINNPMSVYRVSSSGAWSGKSAEVQLRGTINILAEYDKILRYKYTEHFAVKKQRLEEELKYVTSQSSAPAPASIKSYIPPVLVALVRFLVPPALLKRARN